MNVVWLKRDLRITDHGPLYQASLRGDLMVIYVVEDEVVTQPDYGANHHHFIAESLRDLAEQLHRLNIQLQLFHGEMTAVLQAIHEAVPITSLSSHMEVGNATTYGRDKRVKRWCRQNAILWHEFPIYEVLRPHPHRADWRCAHARRTYA